MPNHFAPGCKCCGVKPFNLVKIDPADGRIVWKKHVDAVLPQRKPQLSVYTTLFDCKAIRGTNSIVCWAMKQDGLAYLIRVSSTGIVEWVTDRDDLAPLLTYEPALATTAAGKIYIVGFAAGINRSYIARIDPESGTKVWDNLSVTPTANPIKLAVIGEQVMGLGDHRIVLNDDGTLAHQVATNGASVFILDTASDGVVRTQTGSVMGGQNPDLSAWSTSRTGSVVAGGCDGTTMFVSGTRFPDAPGVGNRTLGLLDAGLSTIWDSADILSSPNEPSVDVYRIAVGPNFVVWIGGDINYDVDSERRRGSILITDKNGIGQVVHPWAVDGTSISPGDARGVCIADDGFIYVSGYPIFPNLYV